MKASNRSSNLVGKQDWILSPDEERKHVKLNHVLSICKHKKVFRLMKRRKKKYEESQDTLGMRM